MHDKAYKHPSAGNRLLSNPAWRRRKGTGQGDYALCAKYSAGKRLASLLQSLVKALNAKEIPTGAGLIESFNREAVNKALDVFVQRLEAAVTLPVAEEDLAQVSYIQTVFYT